NVSLCPGGFVVGGSLLSARRQPDFSVASVTVDAPEVYFAVVYVFRTRVTIETTNTAASRLVAGHPPKPRARCGGITRRGRLRARRRRVGRRRVDRRRLRGRIVLLHAACR